MQEVYGTVDARYLFQNGSRSSKRCMSNELLRGVGVHGSAVLQLHFLRLNGRKLVHSLVGIGNCSQMIRKLRSQDLRSVLNFTGS